MVYSSKSCAEMSLLDLIYFWFLVTTTNFFFLQIFFSFILENIRAGCGLALYTMWKNSLYIRHHLVYINIIKNKNISLIICFKCFNAPKNRIPYTIIYIYMRYKLLYSSTLYVIIYTFILYSICLKLRNIYKNIIILTNRNLYYIKLYKKNIYCTNI